MTLKCPVCTATTLLSIVDEQSFSNGLYDYKWELTIQCFHCSCIFKIKENRNEREKRLFPYKKARVDNDRQRDY